MEANDDAEVVSQLRALEPIFHHEGLGSGREVFEAIMSPDYWEVGASGRVYGREFVIETLIQRYSAPHDDPWLISDFEVRGIADDLYLVTYELDQAGRRSRRSTIWRRSIDGWFAVYHQGTLT